MANNSLRIYLQDHHAAATAGVALGRRTLGSQDPLARQIAGDRDTLEEVMQRLDVSRSRIKTALALVAEQLGRLKADRSLRPRSPVASLLALETLLVGVRGKQALWTALRVADEPQLEDLDFEALAHSASAQAAELEEKRLRAAAEALSDDGAAGGFAA